jgi:aromatic ring hydroxylase
VDSYVHIVERNAVVNGRRGIVISGTKAIVTGAPYMHELLVMPCRNMGIEDADFAVCCAVPIDAPGLTIVARPGRAPRRNAGARRRPVQPQVRPEHRRVHVRPGVRAHGRRVLRRRMGAQRAT